MGKGTLRVQVCPDDGCLFLFIQRSPIQRLLDGPSYLFLTDRLTQKTYSTHGAPFQPVAAGKDILRFRQQPKGAPFLAESTLRFEKEDLRWDVTLHNKSSQGREVWIVFNLPALSRSDRLFLASGSDPYTARTVPREAIYRQGVMLPLATLYRPAKDVGFTAAVPLDLPKPEVRFFSDALHPATSFQVAVTRLWLPPFRAARAAIYLIAHEGDWRPGLGWLVRRYPRYFYPANPATVASEGTYFLGNPQVTEEELRRVKPQGVTWEELHAHFPFYGVYAPDRDTWNLHMDVDTPSLEEWEKAPAFGSLARSKEGVRQAIALHKRLGIQVYIYYQTFEAWTQFARKYFPNDITLDANGRPYPAWYHCHLMNPDPARPWGRYILSQLDGLLRDYPDIDGIFLDRDDYKEFDFAHRDGISAVDNRPVYMLAFAQEKALAEIYKRLHPPGKGIWTNGPTGIEVCKGVDGIMAESGRPWPQRIQYLCPVRPMIILVYDNDLAATEEKLKVSLATGAFPASSPTDPASSDLHDRYMPLFGLLKGRRMVLTAHALALPQGVEGNIFALKDGNLGVTLISPGRTRTAGDPFRYDVPVRVHVPDASRIRACYLLTPEQRGKEKIFFSRKGQDILVSVPRLRSAAMLHLVRGGVHLASMGPIRTVEGQGFSAQWVVDNFTARPVEATLKQQATASTLHLPAFSSQKVSAVWPSGKDFSELRLTVASRETIQIFERVRVPALEVALGGGVSVPKPGDPGYLEVALTNHLNKPVSLALRWETQGVRLLRTPPRQVLLPADTTRLLRVPATVSRPGRGTVRLLASGAGRNLARETGMESYMLLPGAGDLFYDDFRDGQAGRWQIISGQWRRQNGNFRATGASESQMALAGDPSWQDYALQARTKILGSTRPEVTWYKSYVVFRAQDGANFYRFGIHGDSQVADLYKCVGGNWINIANAPFTGERERWYILKVDVRGNHIRCFLNGRLLIDAHDDTFPSGRVGLFVDNFMQTIWSEFLVKR